MEVKAPNQYVEVRGQTSVFLAGSIEMGAAVNWQQRVVAAFPSPKVLFLNPRREYWDPSWDQSADNPQFREQVMWELDGNDGADISVFYFDPLTKSPITLLELGLHAADEKPIVVCCPQGFWRKGNVDIVCQRYGIRRVETLPDMIEELGRLLEI